MKEFEVIMCKVFSAVECGFLPGAGAGDGRLTSDSAFAEFTIQKVTADLRTALRL